MFLRQYNHAPLNLSVAIHPKDLTEEASTAELL